MTGADTLTDAGTLMGTAAYMSPEQAQGDEVTPATDVYSFGVILYRMLAGRLPFESTSAVEILRRQLQEAPPPLAAVRRDAPAGLAAVAESSLAKDPDQRPADGGALVELLGSGEAPTIVAGAPAVTQVMPRPASRRNRAWLAALIALPLLVLAGVALALVATNDEPRVVAAAGPDPEPDGDHRHGSSTSASASAAATSSSAARCPTSATAPAAAGCSTPAAGAAAASTARGAASTARSSSTAATRATAASAVGPG